ncbi:MAG: InlB B-repeat-containing protein [Candidatus Baldrarchaeia archaeon]
MPLIDVIVHKVEGWTVKVGLGIDQDLNTECGTMQDEKFIGYTGTRGPTPYLLHRRVALLDEGRHKLIVGIDRTDQPYGARLGIDVELQMDEVSLAPVTKIWNCRESEPKFNFLTVDLDLTEPNYVRLEPIEFIWKDIDTGAEFNLMYEKEVFFTRAAEIQVKVKNTGKSSWRMPLSNTPVTGYVGFQEWSGQYWWPSTGYAKSFEISKNEEKTITHSVSWPMAFQMWPAGYKISYGCFIGEPLSPEYIIELGNLIFNIWYGKALKIMSNETFKAELSVNPVASFPMRNYHIFYDGTTLQVRAIPPFCHVFSYWEVDGVRYEENPITITMDTNHTATAYFEPAS